MSIGGIVGLDPSVLLGYYQAQLSASPSAIAAANVQNTASATTQNSATANDVLPWSAPPPNPVTLDAQVLSTTDFLNSNNVPLSAGATTDTKMEQDNQKLFSIYNATSTLSTLAQMAQSSTATSGQLAGLNARFQSGLAQIQQYVSSTSFNNFNLQATTPAGSVTSTAGINFGSYTYSTRALVTNSALSNALPNISASQSFNIAIKKNGVTTTVPIDLSQVPGTLNLSNIVGYINSQLSAAGFATRFQKTETGGTATSDSAATYGLQITPSGTEQVSLSAAATPSLYVVGNSGLATASNTDTSSNSSAAAVTSADETGRLTKLSGLDGTPTAAFSVSQDASTGTTTAQASTVDAAGNVYVIGTATGNMGNQLNQGSQDVYLTKYDSAGNVIFQNLLGSGGSASGYGIALDPATGGVVVTGSSTAPLATTSVANGSNSDSFLAQYSSDGTQTWIKQIQTLATNQSNSVSVDASGNIIIGGSVSGGVIGSGQSAEGNGDAYLAKFDSSGKLLAENQFGTSGSDSVAATALGSDGSLYVASTQSGQAILAKYANGDISSAPVWTENLGSLQAGGAIGGIAVSSGNVYVSGTTSNADLTAGGQASVASPASGGLDAFVFSTTDNGTSATPNTVSYVGTSGSDTGGSVTVGSDGTVYLTGSTTGTFASQSRNVQNVTNAFASSIAANGTVNWTRQFGGADGVSTGAGIAIDPQGASVLDALGLPRGALTLNQSVDLTQQTTLRAGDSFQIQIEGVAARTATITIDQGETFDSLVTKINAQLGSTGVAAVNYTGSSENLKISANAGNTLNLIAGPADFDALSRLGISAGVLSTPSASGTTASSSTSSSTSVTPTYGLGLTATALGPLDISTTTGADLTRSTLLSVLSNIQKIYQTTNAPAASTTPANPGNTTGTASEDVTAQLSSYSTALSLLNTNSSDAVNNIQIILDGGTPGSSGSSSSTDSSSSILGLFG